MKVPYFLAAENDNVIGIICYQFLEEHFRHGIPTLWSSANQELQKIKDDLMNMPSLETSQERVSSLVGDFLLAIEGLSQQQKIHTFHIATAASRLYFLCPVLNIPLGV